MTTAINLVNHGIQSIHGVIERDSYGRPYIMGLTISNKFVKIWLAPDVFSYMERYLISVKDLLSSMVAIVRDSLLGPKLVLNPEIN